MSIIPTVSDLTEQKLRVFHLLSALSYDCFKSETVDPLYLESLTLAVLLAADLMPSEMPRKTATLSSEQASRVREMIAMRFAEPLSLRELAETAGLSESYFVRAFKGTFGETPYRYVLRERVMLARSLIQAGDLPLGRIAELSGFPDATRMGRTFRKITGRSPTGTTKKRRASVPSED